MCCMDKICCILSSSTTIFASLIPLLVPHTLNMSLTLSISNVPSKSSNVLLVPSRETLALY